MRYNFFLISLLLSWSMAAQDGGQSSFLFVNVEHSPRLEALGGSAIAVFDNDVSLSQNTPSLLNSEMDNELSFAFGDYFADISLVSCSYAVSLDKIGILGVYLEAINYGDFERNDAAGYNYGDFSASDQTITFGIGRKIHEKFSFGVNLSLLNSNYDTYTSLALSSNISLTYINSHSDFFSTLLIKNIAKQLNAYSYSKERLPYEIQFAVSKLLAHLPFRYHIAYNNVNRFNIKSPYKLTNQTNVETGELEIKEESIAKTFLRHIIVGGELNPFRKSLFIRGGFNFQRRFDLTTISQPAMVGFSWGIGFRLSKYYFDYSRSSYHLSGTPNNFSIATNLSNFGL